jgi:hypothetical protein
MAESTFYRLGSLPENEENNENDKEEFVFGTYSETMKYFDYLLCHAGQDLQNPTSASPELLHKFLKAICRDSQASFRQHLKDSALGVEPEEAEIAYERFELQYHPLKVNQILFLIDEEFLERRRQGGSWMYRRPTYVIKVKNIMTAILWMDRIFPWCVRLDWKMKFGSFHFNTIKDDLKWFRNPCDLLKVMMGRKLSNEEKRIVDNIWYWLRDHDQRAIRLVFAMARHGMDRSLYDERSELPDIIANLNDLSDRWLFEKNGADW